MPKKIRHIGWKVERCRFGLLERIFAEKWQKECQPAPGLNYGYGLLQDLFIKPATNRTLRRHNGAKLIINQRDAFVAATVVQWLGTNVGYGFLTECLRRAGLRIAPLDDDERTPRDYYYSQQHQDGYYVHPGAWHNIAREWAYFEKPPLVADMPRRMEHVQSLERMRERLSGVVKLRIRRRELEASMARWQASCVQHSTTKDAEGASPESVNMSS